ncbi:tRNA (adenine(22)-N(1))-methyltransferase [Tindallia californiensis]|uniref:tRNA (Adenine22-N1)-methyltransferase n=1 Tax=Tindallia californiensis TaxID=159292 RepID=A0A1H3JRL4_9FIRM|nr:class I SAM-dependent methyltransferase [Tindallia californiensis]SDY42567.1 tRNA (adenine22-N1)-methyltransferase [Tindallia californiensis]
MINLPDRLKAIANSIEPVSVVADIGTDHGLLPVYLLQRGIVSRAILSDVNQDPLDKAKKTAENYGFTERIDFRLGDGLLVLAPTEAPVIVIAGMGGILINSLLQSASSVAKKAEYLILQPMQAVPEVRRFLLMNGYQILSDQMVKEKNHFYHILKVTYQELKPVTISPLESLIGLYWKDNSPELMTEFVKEQLQRYQKKQAGLSKSANPDKMHIQKCQEIINELKEVVKWLQQ